MSSFKKIGLVAVLLLSPIIAFVFILLGSIIIIANSAVSVDESAEFNLDDYNLLGMNEAVLAYRPIIEKYASKYGVLEYVPVIMAIMMQESGGMGNDPMQASESYCGRIGCITDPEVSIEQGIKHFKNVLQKADHKLLVAIQSYNFGTNFINWLKKHGGEYTLDLAIQYSKEMYDQEVAKGRGHLYSCAIGEARSLGACFGDYLYVQHVLRYLSFSNPVGGDNLLTWNNPLPIKFTVTSPFRPPHRPNHNGIDLSCGGKHIPVYAVDGGVVVESLYGKRGQGFGGYGNIVLIHHKNNLYTLYAHLDSRAVKKGQSIEKGQLIGTCGGTGDSGRYSYAIHLHFEVRTTQMGGQINPITFFSHLQ